MTRATGLTALLLLLLLPGALHAAGVRLALSGVGANDATGAQLVFPEGVACSAKSADFVVADTGNGRLLRYTLQNGVVQGGDELKLPQLTYPLRVQLATSGDIFALDGNSRRIVHLKSDGSFAGYLEPQGVPAGGTAVVPRGLKLDAGDNLYLLDVANERVLVLDRNGAFQRQIPFPVGFGFAADLAIDGQRILLLDALKARVYAAPPGAAAFTPLTPELRDSVDFPVGIATDAHGRIYLLDQNSSAVIILGGDGAFQGRQLNFGWKGDFLNFPAALCVTARDELLIADRNNSRFEVFKIEAQGGK